MGANLVAVGDALWLILDVAFEALKLLFPPPLIVLELFQFVGREQIELNVVLLGGEFLLLIDDPLARPLKQSA